jgi:WD40 repeat protein
VASNALAPSGKYLAGFDGGVLNILSTIAPDLAVCRSINCASGTIKWSNLHNDDSSRILVYTEDKVRIWDLEDPTWTATINNGSGGMGKIISAEFGRNKQEVLVYTDFGSKLTVWSLLTGRNVEIRDPKFSTSRGQSYRKKLGVFVQITRPAAQDFLSLHAPNSYKVLKSIALPTMDAQGLKWSHDERWLAIWDTSSLGQKLYVYTADANLYRTHTGADPGGIGAIGIRSVEWSPGFQYLAIGGSDRRVTLLSTRSVRSFCIPSYKLMHHSSRH